MIDVSDSLPPHALRALKSENVLLQRMIDQSQTASTQADLRIGAGHQQLLLDGAGISIGYPLLRLHTNQ